MNIFFDIGGSNMRIGKSDDFLRLADVKITKTPASPEEGMEILGEYVRTHGQPDSITGCIAGVISRDGDILKSPNLSQWEGFQLQKEISTRLGVKDVDIKNDALIAGLGESVFGAGKGLSRVVYLTIGTGFGGSLIVDSKVSGQDIGFEPGYQIIDVQDSNGEVAYLEGLVSGSAVQRLRGKPAENIPQTDPMWSNLAQKLAIGINNAVMMWRPDIVILGGSMVDVSPSIQVNEVVNHFNKLKKVFDKPPSIVRGDLGFEVGLYGAMAYRKQLMSLE